MNGVRTHIVLFLLLLSALVSTAQGFSLPEGKKFEKLKFQLINNLIIVPIEVNGTELSFLLDSGVGTPILFNISERDSVQINNVSEITIKGFGDDVPIKALVSRENAFRIKSIVNPRQRLFVVMDKSVNFSTSLGIPVHGIIGYDLFRDFVVDINYTSQTIRLYDPGKYVYRKGRKYEALPLYINAKKAYVNSGLSLKNGEEFPVRLLLDTGSSDALWLFESDTINVPDKHYDDFLGRGLNGNIYGKRTKVDALTIGRFTLSDAKAAFPDKESFRELKNLTDRNGSIGGAVLKRFNVIFDYSKNRITLRKNSNFGKPFQYNLSGLDLQHDGIRYIAESISDSRGVVHDAKKEFGNVQILFEEQTRLSVVPEIVVSAIRAGSPAHEAGLKEGDVILAVNGKKVHRYKLQDILEMVNEREGKRVKLLIERYNSDLLFSFVLKNMFK
ncbi:PDZ domain-containing protein [Zobellia galactanivorans]|uniref:PDZ domain-containing protein n=1 Tax=Zobellia galactanivorans (strain DSM 12802 / CCUG 47099 / CIP 106680 / NCIMB 13871 / Dsij) TaxID=63186 RepID=UPI0020900A25|nr:PDZ domain-containing protein [Zobellia galactanivorans]